MLLTIRNIFNIPFRDIILYIRKMLSKVFNRTSFTSYHQLGKLATAHEALQRKRDIVNLSSLKNGFRVATYLNNRPTTTVGIWVDAGSRSETNADNGVASIFENLVHTGSIKRSSTQLQKDFAKIGANLKSQTTREHSAFYVECLSNDIDRVLDILVDIIYNTNIDLSKLEEQRSNALKRLDEFEQNYRGVVFDNLHLSAYQGTPMALSPLGNKDAINSLTIESVKNYVNDIYKPCRMLLTCVGGGIDHENIHKKAEKYFGHLTNNYDQKIPEYFPLSRRDDGYQYIAEPGIRFTGSEFTYRDDNYPYMYGALAVEGVPRGHLDYLALEVAKTFVGQWSRTYAASFNAPSPIVQESAKSKEIMEYDSFNISYDNTGLFGFYFVLKGLDIDTCQMAMRPMQRGWKYLAISVKEEEVDRAKNALKTNLFSQLETNTQLADYVAKEVLSTNQIIPLDILEQKIQLIDANAMRQAVSRHIYDREIACVAIGRTEAFPIYQEMRYAMSWWRL